MAEHNILGKWGEEVSVQFLVGKGYAIIERNWRLGHLEIDIVAMKDNKVVFVEVKTRKTDVVNPAKVITAAKMQHMVTAANTFVRVNRLPFDVQFDVIFIVGGPSNHTLEHIPDAFRPGLRTRR